MARTEAGLKALLTEIMEDNYRIPGGGGEDYFALSQEMLGHIGSTDPIMRDDLVYDILARWIDGDRLAAGEMRPLLRTSLDRSHLFYGIGESGTDSVFTRSFSALVVALIIGAHRRRPFLSADELRQVAGRAEEYMRAERDVRGYVDGKGWAHAAAHAADVLAELAQCPELSGPGDMRGILAAIKGRVETDDYAYVHEEDERMVTAVVRVMGRKILDDQEIVGWLDSFPATGRISRYPGDLYLRANVKTFFRSLYLRLAKNGPSPVVVSLGGMLGRHSRF